MVIYSAMTITVIGDGGWGTTLAIHLNKKGHEIRLWGVFSDYIGFLGKARENKKFLPGIRIPSNIDILSDINKACAGTELVILAVESD